VIETKTKRCPVPDNSKQKRRDESRYSPPGAAASIFLLAAIALAGASHAAGKDPTVPPPAWQAVQPVAPGTKAVTAVDTSSVRLVLVGKTRQLALIDGQVIKPGDMHNGAKVEAIGRSQVQMEEKEKSLKLAPGVEKKKASRNVAPKQAKRIIVGGTPAAAEKQTGSRSSQ
jgi:hypothetical protein